MVVHGIQLKKRSEGYMIALRLIMMLESSITLL